MIVDWKKSDAITCPHCGTECNAYSEPNGETVVPPHVGALSLCFSCGGLSAYAAKGDTMVLRVATAEEENDVKDDEEIARARKMIAYTDSATLATSLMMMTP